MLHCNGIDPSVTLMGNFNWGPISRKDIVSINFLETMLLGEMGPQLKLPIDVTKGSLPLLCNTYFPKILAI